METLIPINYDVEQPTVSARDLHRALGISKRFSMWFETNSQGFIENEDFCGAYLKVQGNQYGQQQTLRKHVNRVVLDALGGKNTEAYHCMSKKVFSECNRDLQDRFKVNSRNNIPRKRYEEAIDYVDSWTPSTNTKLEIQEANCQQRFAVL